MEPNGWVTLIQARRLWPDAQHLTDEDLIWYLNAAYEAAVEFAPVLADGETAPDAWGIAQVMQARAIFRSVSAGSRDEFLGADGAAVTVFPLDWNVRQLLRPKRGVPTIG